MATTMNQSQNQSPHHLKRWASISYFIAAATIVAVVIMLLMRSQPSTGPERPSSPTLDGRRNDRGQEGETMKPNKQRDSQPGPVQNPINPGP